MPTPMQIEDALRRSDPPASAASAASAPTPPTQTVGGVTFGKRFTPEERALQQKALVQLLRQRK